MFQMSSGEGAPEVLHVNTTSAPSCTVTLDGLRVAMGTTANENEGEIQCNLSSKSQHKHGAGHTQTTTPCVSQLR